MFRLIISSNILLYIAYYDIAVRQIKKTTSSIALLIIKNILEGTAFVNFQHKHIASLGFNTGV